MPLKGGVEPGFITVFEGGVPKMKGPQGHAVPEYAGVLDLGRIQEGLYGVDRRDLPGFPVGNLNTRRGPNVSPRYRIPAMVIPRTPHPIT